MSTRASFDLIDQPWVPCATLEGGPPRDLSLRETFARAPSLREVADASPLVTVALYRLLLAVLHRTHGPRTTAEWRAIWERGHFDLDALDAYFSQWRERFDLFHPVRPFYQTARIETRNAKPVREFIFGMTLGNYALLFDHSNNATELALAPAAAARHLLAFHSFAVGGLIGLQSCEPPVAPYKSAVAAPLNTSAVAVVRGGTLFETLLLNLVRYDGAHGYPFYFGAADRPAWERDERIVVGPRQPDGYLDLLTWQSRRLLLLPEEIGSETLVRRVVIMNGSQIPHDWHSWESETMVAYRSNPRAKPQELPWIPIRFSPDRALWRDSTALFQSVADQHRRPKTIDWARDVLFEVPGARGGALSVDLYGLSTDQASILLWRHERFPLPPALLDDRDRYNWLRRGVELAEEVGALFRTGFDAARDSKRKVPRPMQVLAEALAAQAEGQEPRREAVSEIAAALDPSAAWWARLEIPFRTFIRELGDETEETDGRAYMAWTATLRQAARATFAEVVDGLGDSARALRAAARTEPLFDWRLGAILGPAPTSSPASPGEEHAA